MHRGRVESLHRWPVKSLRGEDRDALDLDGRGVAGDRTHALHDVRRDRRLTGRVAPRMMAWGARYPAAEVAADDPAPPLVTAPDGRRFAWDDAALPGALTADLGREIRLTRDPAGQQDLGRSVLVTFEATRLAVEERFGAPLDLRRFRTNVHVVAEDVPALAEHGWEGRRLRIGDAELELLHPCGRCVMVLRDPDDPLTNAVDVLKLAPVFGMNARPLHAARIRAGDPVEVA